MNRIITILLLFFVLNSVAVVSPDKSDRHFILDAPSHFVKTGVDLVSSPFQWDKKDWFILGSATAITTASVFLFDDPVSSFLRSNRNSFIYNSLSPFDYSDLYYTIPVFAGFTITGFATKNNYTLETAYMLAESCFYSALLTRTVKFIAGRHRPGYRAGISPFDWEIASGQHSFFSGHTSMFFAMASVISWRYRHNNWVPWASYGIASLVGFQRLYYNRHWLSDVLAGAFSATAIGLFIAKNDKQNPLKLYPVLSPQVTGLSMVIPIR